MAIPDLKQETSEVSGSKGEANFVWRCKVCKVRAIEKVRKMVADVIKQRESTASIKDAPRAYIQESPPKSQKIIEIDCRGLEFTEFRAEV